MLVRTSEGDYLNPDAAASYELMNDAFTAAFGKRLSITSGARTHQQQINAFLANYVPYNTGTGDARYWPPEAGQPLSGRTYWRKRDTYPGQYATVAAPGKSNHEDPPGRAADFGSGVQTRGTREHNWMLANAWRWGWEWTGGTFITIEPWHWEKTRPTVAGGSSKPLPEKTTTTPAQPVRRRRRNMTIAAAYRDANGTVAVQARLGGALTLLPDPVEFAGIAAATGVETYQVTTLDALRATFAEVPHPFYDDGRFPLRILAAKEGGPSRYGALGERAWAIPNTTQMQALQNAGAEVVILPQADIDKMLDPRVKR